MVFGKTDWDRAQSDPPGAVVRGALHHWSESGIGSARAFDRRDTAAFLVQAKSRATPSRCSAPWSELAAAYAAMSGVPNSRILTLQLSHGNPDEFADALITATETLRAGDVVALDIVAKTARQRSLPARRAGCTVAAINDIHDTACASASTPPSGHSPASG